MKYLASISFILFFATILAAQQPNVLLVILDDIGVAEIPRYAPLDATKASMPNLEALMDRGLTFDNVWSNPVCAPSRANILTGRHGFRTNVLNPTNLGTLSKDETSLHQYISDNAPTSYSNSLIGKWHLGGTGVNPEYSYPNDLGIEYFAGIMGGGVSDYQDYTLVEDGDGNSVTDYITTKFSDLAIDWIADQDKPWFCWLAYNAAHTPLHLPPNDLHTYDDLSPLQDSIDANPLPYFLAMIESVDTEMGRVINSMSQEELDNTVIIVVGDNGTSRNVIQSPYRPAQSKGSLYQGGVHVAMVVSGKDVTRQNENEAALVSFSDLFSTIVEMTGTELNQYEDSFSFFDLLTQAGTGQRSCMYTESANTIGELQWTSRDATFKYIRFSDGVERFYNLIVDPYETRNLLMDSLDSDQQLAFDKLSMVKEDLTTSTSEIEDADIFIYPNPASDFIYIYSELSQLSSFQIVNAQGRVVKSGKLDLDTMEVDVSALIAGAYWFVVDHKYVQRFVKVD